MVVDEGNKDLLNLEVVPMTLEHINDVMTIEELCFTIPWSRESLIQEIKSNRLARYIVAVSNRRVVGYAGLWKIIDEGHITNIAVHPEFQGVGIGNILMDKLLELARKENIKRLTLEVRAGNTRARNLYRKYGFVDHGIRRGYYADNKEDAIIMWKTEGFD